MAEAASVNDGYNEKRTLIEEKLNQRTEERLADVRSKKDEKIRLAAVDESTTVFSVNFATERDKIEKMLQSVDSVNKPELSDFCDELSELVQKLQKYLNDSTRFLPSYDVRQGQQTIARLQSETQTKRQRLIPKKKFAFKSKTKVSEKKDAIDVKPIESSSALFKVKVDQNECGFADKDGELLTLPDLDIDTKDVALARLANCTVKLYGAPSAVHIDKLTKCTVLCGPVSGSIFIDNCSDCVFVLGCQQLRIHHTTDTEFYIHVTSKAIIEDCSGVAFAPYNLRYPGLDQHYELSGLNRSRNNWNDVDDFDWLASDKHSPNWSLIGEDERKNIVG